MAPGMQNNFKDAGKLNGCFTHPHPYEIFHFEIHGAFTPLPCVSTGATLLSDRERGLPVSIWE
jgi:hypothetical protein